MAAAGQLPAPASDWAAAFLLYPLAVAAWRLSTREVTLGSIGCDTVLLLFLAVAMATKAAAVLAPGLPSLPLQVLGVAAVLAACARTFDRHVRGPRFRPVDMGGKICIVTGANTGIGLETCRELVRMGGTVVMACRSEARAKAAAESVIVSTGCQADRVPFIALDLSSLRSVGAFCDTFNTRYGVGQGLDVLVCNAGLMQPEHVLTEDGIELTMAANHFGHFALIQRLLPQLERCKSGGRIVNVGSALAHNASSFAIDDVMSEKTSYSMFGAYTQSKLANAMLTTELHRRMAARGSKVAVNVIHPGTVHTDVTRNFALLVKLGYWLSQPLMRLLEKSPAEGAYTSIHVATAPELQGVSGQYFVHCAAVEMPAVAQQEASCERLWELSETLTVKATAAAAAR